MKERKQTNFKGKITKKRYCCQNAGIILIAIVVTIITLLILAGVTINLAIGDYGIIGKAEDASNLYANTSIEEKTTLSEMKNKVKEQKEKRENDGSTKIKDSSGKLIDLANIETYNDQTYQLFLVDELGKYSNKEGRIWIQRKDYFSMTASQLSNNFETTGIATPNSILWQVNPDLDSKYGNEIRALNSWSSSLKGVTYLCNTENWNSTYVKSEDLEKGAYSIGGASVEMYCDAYNKARKVNSSSPGFFNAKAFNNNGFYGYRYKPGNGNSTWPVDEDGYGYWTDQINYPILTSEFNSMFILSGSNSQWLSSPATERDYNLAVVYASSKHLSGYNYMASSGYNVRPMVSLPYSMEIQLTN